VALAMLPVAEEYKKILLVEPAVADSITGDKWNKYIFRTGRNSVARTRHPTLRRWTQPGNVIAILANDNAFGRDGVKATKEFTKKAKIVHEEYLPVGTTDFTAGLQRIIDKLKDQPGNKYLSVGWSGSPTPFPKIADLDLEKRYGIKLATGGNILPAMVAYKNFPGMEGALYYYFGIPKNPANEWLVANHYSKFKTPPDFFTAGGMSAAIAVVEALKKTKGDTSTEQAHQRHGGHELRDAQGQDDLPQGRPPGDAGHVPFPHQERPGLRLGRAGAGARDPGQRAANPDPQQALIG
jgi:branched-chain amino acid transport system substrate-binding protein